MKETIRLLAKAIERVTVNTYVEQGAAAANEVFKILKEIENRLEDMTDDFNN